jgi:RNA polymerase sigma-70 factor (ECF subfamily)
MHALTVTGFIPDNLTTSRSTSPLVARERSTAVTDESASQAASRDGAGRDGAVSDAGMSDAAQLAAARAEREDIEAATSGDRRAFERLYRTHGQRVFALCLRMCGERTLAEELVQDVFVRAWQKLESFRGDAAFSTWLHRVAVNIVLSRRKQDGRVRDRTVADDEAVHAVAARAVSVGDRMDLEAAIATLPTGARRIFVLHDVEGYTHEEIGELLGITSGGSKAQLHRARLLLREVLST